VSPLHTAAAKGHSQIVKLLLERGADVSYYLRCELVATPKFYRPVKGFMPPDSKQAGFHSL
jgi:hypothetical protein